MGKFQDLTGQTFGYLKILYRAEPKENVSKKRTYWHCLCTACGREKDIVADKLKRGQYSCGCTKDGLSLDLTGKKFGRLTALSRVKKDGIIYWNCICDCGNTHLVKTAALTRGEVKSCGCLQRDVASEANSIDLTGQRFNRLTVIRRADDGKRWLCRCDCGNETEVVGTHLKSGVTKSCGCLNREKLSQRLINLSGQRFGHLVAEYPVMKDGKTFFHCKCDCGNEKDIWSHALISGTTKSCGCRTGVKRYSETIRANCGLNMHILEENGNTDVTVEFEDGTVVEHKSYGDYRNGYIKHPILSKPSGKTFNGYKLIKREYRLADNSCFYLVDCPDGQRDILSAEQMTNFCIREKMFECMKGEE